MPQSASTSNPFCRVTRAKQRLFLAACCCLLLLFAPQWIASLRYGHDIHEQIGTISPGRYAVVFGALVFDDFTLSDALRERMDAAILLHRQGKAEILFLSGTNRHNREVEVMAEYAIARGVDPDDILLDLLGIDTHDTCRHFARIGSRAIFVSQGYHLPRLMLMCEREGVTGAGLAVEHLNLLEQRGDDALQILAVRSERAAREAALTWAFLIGLYDRISAEAESLE